MEFALAFEASQPWNEAAYFFRVSIDSRASRVCQVAFDPRVAGAVVDTCNAPRDSEEHDFRVEYRYDAEVRQIYGVTFSGQPHHVDLTLLVSDDRPPLAETHHDVRVNYTSLGAGPCALSCGAAEPLVVQLAEPGDAGMLPDAAAPAPPVDAAAPGPSDGGRAPDAAP